MLTLAQLQALKADIAARFHENYVAPPEAIELDGVVNAKAVLINE